MTNKSRYTWLYARNAWLFFRYLWLLFGESVDLVVF